MKELQKEGMHRLGLKIFGASKFVDSIFIVFSLSCILQNLDQLVD